MNAQELHSKYINAALTSSLPVSHLFFELLRELKALSAPEPLPDNKTLTTGLPVRIKGLVWEHCSCADLQAKVMFGCSYRVTKYEWWFFQPGATHSETKFHRVDGIEHAMQLCQQDFEKRLREWVVPDDGKEIV